MKKIILLSLFGLAFPYAADATFAAAGAHSAAFNSMSISETNFVDISLEDESDEYDLITMNDIDDGLGEVFEILNRPTSQKAASPKPITPQSWEWLEPKNTLFRSGLFWPIGLGILSHDHPNADPFRRNQACLNLNGVQIPFSFAPPITVIDQNFNEGYDFQGFGTSKHFNNFTFYKSISNPEISDFDFPYKDLELGILDISSLYISGLSPNELKIFESTLVGNHWKFTAVKQNNQIFLTFKTAPMRAEESGFSSSEAIGIDQITSERIKTQVGTGASFAEALLKIIDPALSVHLDVD